MSRRQQALLALAALTVAVAARGPLEQTMQWHMVVHLPLLFAVGVLLGGAVAPRTGMSSAWRAWNVQGVAGLLLAGGVLMAWMVPRALDAAVEQWSIDAVKAVSLVAAGALARTSWHEAGAVVRTFAVGNAVWMTATIGMLLLDAPERLCTSYGASDQRATGITLIAVTLMATLGVGWYWVYGPRRLPVRAD